MFDAVDTQVLTPARRKEPAGPVLDKPVHLAVKTSKGGPRIALYELCKKLQWPTPKFDSVKVQPSTAGGSSMKATTQEFFFASNITLHVPNSDVISLRGDGFADKKSSQDSAALLMLHELQRRGRLQVQEVGP